MDIHNLLSRRSLLKGSTVLAAASIVAPAAAMGSHAVPAVLATLLAEYRAAHIADSEANQANRNARDLFARACSRNRLYLPWVCGAQQSTPWLGEMFSGSVDPWTAKHRMDNVCADELDGAKAAGADLSGVRKEHRNMRRRFNRQLVKYEARRDHFKLAQLQDACTDTYHRAHDAQKALEAYPLETVDEVRVVARAMYETNLISPGAHGFGYTLVRMLNPSMGA